MNLRKLFIIISCLFYVLFYFSETSFATHKTIQETKKKNIFISLKMKGEPLGTILDTISEQTGYVVKVDKKLANYPIYGNFDEVNIDVFFQRALRGQNISILFDDKKGYIFVRSFGEKDSRIDYVVSQGKGKSHSGDQEKIKRLHALQLREIQEFESNPESVEPLTGIRLADIKSLQERQQRQIHEYENKPESVEPLTGVKLVDIKALHAQEERVLQEYEDNPKSIAPLTGVTLSTIKTLHARQIRQIEEYEDDPESVEPFTGIKLSDIRAMHERQQRVIDGFSQ